MSVYLNTEIIMEGTKEELVAMMKLLRTYATDNAEQYRRSRDCCYLEWVRATNGNNEVSVRRMTDSDMADYVDRYGNSIQIIASGPYGNFTDITEVTLFEEMAVAAPTATFDGTSAGFMTPAHMSCRGILKDGIVHLSAFFETEMQWMESGVQNSELQAVFDPVKKEYTQL